MDTDEEMCDKRITIAKQSIDGGTGDKSIT